MAFNKETRLFFLTILGLVAYVRGDFTVNVQHQTGCNEGVSFSQENIKCDLITCPSETDLCYVLKIYDAQNSVIGRENICYSKDEAVLANITDVPTLSAASAVKELTLRSNANFEYFVVNKVERSVETMSEIKEYLAKKKEEERISIEEFNTNMATAQKDMNMKSIEMGKIGSRYSGKEMGRMMQKVGSDMRKIGQRMTMIGNILRENLRDIQHVSTSDIYNYCRNY